MNRKTVYGALATALLVASFLGAALFAAALILEMPTYLVTLEKAFGAIAALFGILNLLFLREAADFQDRFSTYLPFEMKKTSRFTLAVVSGFLVLFGLFLFVKGFPQG